MLLSSFSEIIDDENTTKPLDQVLLELKEKTRLFELYKTQLKQKKNNYNKELKEYNKILNQVIQNENYIDKKENVISKLKTQQQLLLSTFSIEEYKMKYCEIDLKILEGFVLFLGYNTNQLPFLNFRLQNKESIIKMLEIGESIQRNLYQIQKMKINSDGNNSFEIVKNVFKKIYQKYKANLIQPFGFLFEFIKLLYLIIDKEYEIMKEKEEIEDKVYIKNGLFLKLKGIEDEINNFETIINEYEEYMMTINKLIDDIKADNSQRANRDINEFNTMMKELNKTEKLLIKKLKSFKDETTSRSNIINYNAKNNELKSNKPRKVPMSSLILTSNSKALDPPIIDKKIINFRIYNNYPKFNKTTTVNDQAKESIHKVKELSPKLVHLRKKMNQINRLSKNEAENIYTKKERNRGSLINNEYEYYKVSYQIKQAKELKNKSKKQKHIFEISTSTNLNNSKYIQSSFYQSIPNDGLSYNNENAPKKQLALSLTQFKELHASKIISNNNSDIPNKTIKNKIQNKDFNLFYVETITSNNCCVSCT